MRLPIKKFDGFISSYDVDPNKIGPTKLADTLNFELNSPLFALTQAKGYDTDVALPDYSGSRTVAFRKWSVDYPSEQEITTLVTASDNLLRFSEDFEVTTFKSTTCWQWTADGETRKHKSFTDAIFGRKGLEITSVGNTTAILQDFSGTIGTTYTFSLYVKRNNIDVSITVGDSSGDTTYEVTASGRWYVTRTLINTGSYIKVSFPDGTNAESVAIWGAQLEVGTAPTGYGRTTHFAKPYSIWINPYYNGSAWVSSWRELTEQMGGKAYGGITGGGDCQIESEDTVSAATLESNDYFNNWVAYKDPTSSAFGVGFYINDYVQSTGTFKTGGDSGLSDLVLRGIFMLRPEELHWFYQHGAHAIFPDRWEEYLAPILVAERGDLLGAYHRRLTGDDAAAAQAAARAWSGWEGATSHLLESESTVARFGADEFALALARIESHYFVNGGFLDAPDQILHDNGRIRNIGRDRPGPLRRGCAR